MYAIASGVREKGHAPEDAASHATVALPKKGTAGDTGWIPIAAR